MFWLITTVVALLALSTPAHAQSCGAPGYDSVARDLDSVLDSVSNVPQGSPLDPSTARALSWTMDALEFELDTVLEMVDIGHVKTAEVIAEVVLGELEQIRELAGLCDEDWARLVALYTELFDKKTLGSPDLSRGAVDALMRELGRHGEGTGWADSFDR